MPRQTFTFEGKRYDITAKTERELGAKVEAKKKALEEGSIIVNKNTTVKNWAEKWLEIYKRPNVGDATFYAYECRLRVHIYPAIGGLKLKDVKPLHLQQILNESAGASRDHLKKIHYTIERLFADAVANQLLIVNPAANLTMPSATTGGRRAITDSERTVILKVAENSTSGLWIKTMLYCGLRPAETAALQGRHLDLKRGILKIENSLKRHTNEIGDTKTEAGKRIIPIPDILLSEFKNLKIGPYEYVFKNRDGNHLSSSGMRKRWLTFKRAMNIEMGCKVFRNEVMPPFRVADDLVPYCLRHTYCTDLQSAGVPINVAKELMGHSDISITAKIYTHHSEIAFDNAKQLINNLHSPTNANSHINSHS